MGEYSVEDFSTKLRNIRLQRGYRSQSRLCRDLNVSRQTWNLWEKGLRLPSIAHLAEIANVLEVNPLYFFRPDLSQPPVESPVVPTPVQKVQIPFVETSIARKIFSFVAGACSVPGVYLVHTPGKVGTSRALEEFCRSRNLVPEEIFYNGQEGSSRLLIVDHADEWLEREEPRSFFTDPGKIVILVGKEVKEFLKKEKLFHRIKRVCNLDVLNYNDFDDIVNAAFPAASLEILTLVKAEACLDLGKLYNILLEIRKQGQEPDWTLDFESVYELFDKKKDAQE